MIGRGKSTSSWLQMLAFQWIGHPEPDHEDGDGDLDHDNDGKDDDHDASDLNHDS